MEGKIDTISNVLTGITKFGAKGKGLKSFDITIFNRWGVKVFDKINYIPEIKEDGEEQTIYLWDGTKNNGNKIEDGTYFYILKAKTLTDEVLPERKGTVTVLR
jgi:hypothetical protein